LEFKKNFQITVFDFHIKKVWTGAQDNLNSIAQEYEIFSAIKEVSRRSIQIERILLESRDNSSKISMKNFSTQNK